MSIPNDAGYTNECVHDLCYAILPHREEDAGVALTRFSPYHPLHNTEINTEKGRRLGNMISSIVHLIPPLHSLLHSPSSYLLIDLQLVTIPCSMGYLRVRIPLLD